MSEQTAALLAAYRFLSQPDSVTPTNVRYVIGPAQFNALTAQMRDALADAGAFGPQVEVPGRAEQIQMGAAA